MTSRSAPPEEWRDVRDYEGLYEVSSLGRVRNARTGRVLKLSLWGRQMDTLQVRLSKDGKIRSHLVRRLVALAFVPRPRGTVLRDKVITINSDPTDIRAENLCWASMSEIGVITVDKGHNEKAKRTHCPRGHELVAPNLVASRPNNTRGCLACARALAKAHYRGTEISQQEADEYYHAIMSTS